MTALRVTKELIESRIRSVHYVNIGAAVLAQQPEESTLTHEDLGELSLVTTCYIIMENGFKVEGVSACVDPANYDETLGRSCAYENAFEKLWQLEGYLLKEAMYQDEQTRESLAGFALEGDCEGCKI